MEKVERLWWPYLKAHWKVYLLGALSIMLCNIMEVLIPKIIGMTLDLFKDGQVSTLNNIISINSKEDFIYLFYAFIGAYLILTFARWAWRITLARQGHEASAYLRLKIWERVRFFKKKDLESTYTVGNLMNCSTSDVNTAKFAFGFTLIAFFNTVFLGLLATVMMLTIDVSIALWTLAIFPILPFIMKKISSIEGLRYEKAQEYLTSFNSQASSAIATIRLQRVTQTGKLWERKLNHSAEEYRQKRLSAIFTSLSYYPLMGIGTIFSYGILFAMGIAKVQAGTISIGDFIAMQSYIFLLQEPLMDVGFIISEKQRAATSIKRLKAIYNVEPAQSLLDKNKIEKVKEIQREPILSINQINFSYQKSKKLIKDLSLELNKGDRLGIMGPIGSGKTTLIQILGGLERNYEGKIDLCGMPLAAYRHLAVRDYMTIIPQKPFLFADTIRNNISLDLNLSDDEIWHFLEIAGLRSDIESFERGLDTGLGEWGLNLSGGQKQRLTLARGLARKPAFLFLDDCLSAVDTVTEEKILSSLNDELRDTTIVWVAHRRSTLKYCHKIVELI